MIGEAVVLKVFRLTGSRAASVGGCRVKQGKLMRNATYRLMRDGEVRHLFVAWGPEAMIVPPSGGS